MRLIALGVLALALILPASIGAQPRVDPAQSTIPAPAVPPPATVPAAPPAARPSVPVDVCLPRGVTCAPGSTPCCAPTAC